MWRLWSAGRRFVLFAGLSSAFALAALPATASKGVAPAPAEVVVRAKPGPAVWRVRRGPSELVILGTVSPTPSAVEWNTWSVVDALRGARVLLLSPGSTPGLAWADYFPESERYRLHQPFGHTLDGDLGEDAAARFHRMADAIGQPWSRYATYRPAPAGMVLLEDLWRARRMSGGSVDAAVVALARAAHVRVVRVDEGGALPLIDAMPSMSPPQQLACAASAMDQFNRQGAEVEARYAAWSVGDLSKLDVLYRPPSLCIDDIPGGDVRRARAAGLWLKALEGALDTPGRAVVLMDVDDLLAPSSVLDALRARGAVVLEPLGEPPGGSGGMLVAARRPDPPTMISPPPTTPRDFAGTSTGPLQALAPLRIARMVPPQAASDLICEQAQRAGTLFERRVCHTRREWDEMERRRSLHQLEDLRREATMHKSLRFP